MDINPNVKKYAPIAGAAVLGTTVGYVAGFIVGRRKAQLEAFEFWRAVSEEEIENIRQATKLLRKEPPYDTPGGAVEEMVDPDFLEEIRGHIQEHGYGHVEVSESDENDARESMEEDEVHNVFDENGDEALLHSPKDPNNPYVITVGEFMADETDYDKITVTYFDGDDTLADEREEIIHDVAATVGEENLHKFGVGSGDLKVAYVRNDRIRTDFEIILDEEKYSEKILGFIEEQPKPRSRRKKLSDEPTD